MIFQPLLNGISITNTDFDEYFGFTDTEVYCPWDVINYCKDYLSNPSAAPKNYWMNTSGNNVINHFIDSIDQNGQLTRSELEPLVNGATVQKGNLESECQRALRQIDETGYTDALHQEDIHKILKYGIACRRKDCRVMMETEG